MNISEVSPMVGIHNIKVGLVKRKPRQVNRNDDDDYDDDYFDASQFSYTFGYFWASIGFVFELSLSSKES